MDLTVPSKRSGDAYHTVLLANDISIEKAVKCEFRTRHVCCMSMQFLPAADRGTC